MSQTVFGKTIIQQGDFLKKYNSWETPTVIVSDGPYGISGFPGDPPTEEKLGEFYEPFIKVWTEKSTLQTTLWFWNTELGWAKVHPVLEKYGWEYVNCHIWDKGKQHVAGNANTKTLRKLPVVTEICVQYVMKPEFTIKGEKVPMKEWLRSEWVRSGLPLSKTNEACGVKNAASRKYFTNCHLWYFPPVDAFEQFAAFANKHGKKEGKPYFSLDGKKTLTKEQWCKMRAKFYCPFGVTNVWSEPPLNGTERVRLGQKAMHLNQKPLKFMRLIIESTSDEGDVVWEPFGGLCSAAVAATQLGRQAYATEISKDIYTEAIKRMKSSLHLSPLLKRLQQTP